MDIHPDPTIKKSLYSLTELTFLKDTDSLSQQQTLVSDLIDRAMRHECLGVCVRERWVKYAKEKIQKENSSLILVSVAGFPQGDLFTTEEKVSLIRQAIIDGATEVDVVIPLNWVKQEKYDLLREEWLRLHEVTGMLGLKIIFENTLLDETQKKRCYELAADIFLKNPLGLRFFKTSTGYYGSATLEDVELMAQYTQGKIGIKAAGGIKTWEQAYSFYQVVEKNKEKVPYFRIGSSSIA